MRDEAGQAGRLRLRLRRLLLLVLRLALRLVLRLVRVRLELLGQGLGVELGLGLLALRELLLRPPLELRQPATAPQEEDEHPRHHRHRDCLAPSSWWCTRAKPE